VRVFDFASSIKSDDDPENFGVVCTATCPQGKQSRKWQPDTDVAGQDVIQIRFAKKDCQACAVRSACTRAKTEPRTLTVRTQGYHEVLQAARQPQRTIEFKEQYAKRAGIEGTLSQGVRAFDLRRSRYIGLAKTHLQHILIAAAICGSTDAHARRGIDHRGLRLRPPVHLCASAHAYGVIVGTGR
jgi:hypothetical protein